MAPPKKKQDVEPEAIDPSETRADQFLKSDIVKAFLKDQGKTLLMKGSDFKKIKIQRIPTGIFPLDYALGGGFPAGRVSLVWGPKSSTKTTTLLKAIAQAQKMCANCWYPAPAGKCPCKDYRKPAVAYIDAEGALSLEWAAINGVDTDDLMISQPEYGEQALDTLELLIKGGTIDLVILDSLAFLTPLAEIKADHEQNSMGAQARMVGRGMRKLVSALNLMGNETGRRPTVFLVNQEKQKITMFGDPSIQACGLATGFATSVEIKFKAGKYELDEGEKDAINRPVYVEVGFKIEKNKVSKPRIEGTYRMMLADTTSKKLGDIYDESIVLSMAERTGLAKKIEGSTKWTCLGEEFRGRSTIEEYLLQHQDFKDRLTAALFQIEHPGL